MRAKTQKPIFFDNTCKCIVDYVELESAIIWMQETNTNSKKKIYLHGNYPAVTIGKNKIHVHRLLKTYWENRSLDRSEYCHHKNHNKLDCTKNNIEIIKDSIHQSNHNKGKVLSTEHKIKIGIANRKRKGMKYKKKIHKNPELIK